ncbi:MAG: Hint domain-containing protein [Paracoccus sp. (in: a-proteobacteria)]
MTGGAGLDTMDGGDGNDAMSGGLDNDSMTGGAGLDTMDGGDGNDAMSGGLDNDSMTGGAGLDTMDGGDGNDAMSGGAGNDSLLGGAGADTIDGGADADLIDGGAGNDSLLGGAGNDTVTGGAGDDFLNGGAGTDSLTGGIGSDRFDVGLSDTAVGGDDRDTFTLTMTDGGTGNFTVDGSSGIGSTADFDTLLIGSGLTYVLGSMQKTPDPDGNSFSGSFRVTDGTNTYTVNFSEIESLPNCYARGSRIETRHGLVPVEELRVGDMVRTRDNGYKAISWIGSRSFANDGSAGMQRISPYRIRAGAFGEGVPARDLYLSPQHRVLVRSRIARRMFGQDEVLVAVKHLAALSGVEPVLDFDLVEYFHFLFDQHEIVFADGLEAESLHTGAQAMKSLSPDALEEIFTIFPELADPRPEARPATARLTPRGSPARQLARRHLKNGVPMQAKAF